MLNRYVFKRLYVLLQEFQVELDVEIFVQHSFPLHHGVGTPIAHRSTVGLPSPCRYALP